MFEEDDDWEEDDEDEDEDDQWESYEPEISFSFKIFLVNTMIQYTLRKGVYNRLLHLKGKLVCKKCGVDLKMGELVKGHRNAGTSKLYHSDCYENLYIDLDYQSPK